MIPQVGVVVWPVPAPPLLGFKTTEVPSPPHTHTHTLSIQPPPKISHMCNQRITSEYIHGTTVLHICTRELGRMFRSNEVRSDKRIVIWRECGLPLPLSLSKKENEFALNPSPKSHFLSQEYNSYSWLKWHYENI